MVDKNADCLKEELSAVEVVLLRSFEHFLHDLLLGFEKLAISLLQSFGHVVKHFREAFLEEGLRSGARINNLEEVKGDGLKVIWVEEVNQISVVDEVSMLDQEEAVDRQIDHLPQGKIVGLNRGEELQDGWEFALGEVNSEVEQKSDDNGHMESTELLLNRNSIVLLDPVVDFSK